MWEVLLTDRELFSKITQINSQLLCGPCWLKNICCHFTELNNEKKIIWDEEFEYFEATTDRTSTETGVLHQAVLLYSCSPIAKIHKKYLWISLIVANLYFNNYSMQLYQKMKSLRAFFKVSIHRCRRTVVVNNYVKLLHHGKKFNEKHAKLETNER